MPEGDTVWLTARRLDAALAGKPLSISDFRVPQLATLDLTGRRVLEVVARGKHLLTRVEDGLTIHTHFRMDGSFRLFRSGAPWRGGPAWQIRLVLGNEDWTAVGFRLPVVEVLPTTRERDAVGQLGPDLLGPDWDLAGGLRNLRTDPVREIGSALLDQRNLAGLGNLYRTEALYLRGVSPWTPVGSVADLAALVDLGRRLMLANRGHVEQSTTGARSRGEAHYVFERQGRPCRRCASIIRVAEQGDPGYTRVTYWCPTCQPGPAPAGSTRRGVTGAPRRYRG